MFWLQSLKEDLKDVAEHYEMHAVQEGKPALEPSGVKAFWVAEIVSPSTRQIEIVGCISLGKAITLMGHIS